MTKEEKNLANRILVLLRILSKEDNRQILKDEAKRLADELEKILN